MIVSCRPACFLRAESFTSPDHSADPGDVQGTVYDHVIQEVCAASQVDFEEGGVDQQTLEEMRTVRIEFPFLLAASCSFSSVDTTPHLVSHSQINPWLLSSVVFTQTFPFSVPVGGDEILFLLGLSSLGESSLPPAEGGQGGVFPGFWEGATLGLSGFISAAPTPNTTHCLPDHRPPANHRLLPLPMMIEHALLTSSPRVGSRSFPR